MSYIKDWQNSLRFSPYRRKRNDELEIGCKFLRHNVKDSSIGQFEKSRKMGMRCEIEAEAVSSAIGQNWSNLSTNRHYDCLDDELQESDVAMDYATYLKAFALIYVLPEEEWRADNIDKLLVEGEELFQASSDGDITKKAEKKSTVYNSDDQRIKRKFQLQGHNFTLELRPPYMGDAAKPADLRPRHILRNLKQVLRTFFQKAYYCLLLQKTSNLLLWRRGKLYFAMDMKSEQTDRLRSTRPRVGILVCLTSLDNVVHLITNLSGDNPNSAFRIRELAVVRLVTPDGRIFMRDTNKRSPEYQVINSSYAYLKSNLHLSLNPKDILRNGSSIVVGVSAIIASSIEHPASWNTDMLDRLICYSVELYRCCWKATVKDGLPMDLDTFPTQLRIGQFVAEIELLPGVGTGRWRFGIPTQISDLEFEIRRVLKEFGNTLFQIGSQIYAIWLKDDFYYVLDPYRHLVVNPHVKKNSTDLSKWATVRMFRDILSMLNVFSQQLRESNRKSTFYLHTLRIKNIAKCPPGYALKPARGNVPNIIPTINESIEFPLKLDKCEKILLDISDYEPDITSFTDDVVNWEDLSAEATSPKILNVQDVEMEESIGIAPMSKKNARAMAGLDLPAVGKKEIGIQMGFASFDKNLWEFGKQTVLDKANNPKLSKQSGKPPVFPNKFAKLEAELCAKYRPVKIAPKQLTDCNQFQNNLKSTNDASHKSESQNSVCDNQAPVTYPVYTKYPFNLAIAGSESGTMESLNRLLDSAFRVTNRVFTITPWGNYVVFKQPVGQTDSEANTEMFYLFDGCTCNIDRFRHLDLSHGTAGLMAFQTQSQVVCYMIDSRETRAMRALRFHVDQSTKHSEPCPARGT